MYNFYITFRYMRLHKMLQFVSKDVYENVLMMFMMNDDKYSFTLINTYCNDCIFTYNPLENNCQPILQSCMKRDYKNLSKFLSVLQESWETIASLNTILFKCVTMNIHCVFKYFASIPWFKVYESSLFQVYLMNVNYETMVEFHDTFPETFRCIGSCEMKNIISSKCPQKIGYINQYVRPISRIYKVKLDDFTEEKIQIISSDNLIGYTMKRISDKCSSYTPYEDLIRKLSSDSLSFLLEYYKKNTPNTYMLHTLFREISGKFEQAEFFNTFDMSNVKDGRFLYYILDNQYVYKSNKSIERILKFLPLCSWAADIFSKFMIGFESHIKTISSYHEFYHKDDPLDVKLKNSYTLRMFKKIMMILSYFRRNCIMDDRSHKSIIQIIKDNLDSAYTILFNEV